MIVYELTKFQRDEHLLVNKVSVEYFESESDAHEEGFKWDLLSDEYKHYVSTIYVKEPQK